MSSFPTDSSFKVSPDQARQRIAAANLAGVVAQHNGTLRSIDHWGRQVQSSADTLDDVVFDLGEDNPEIEACISRLQEVARSMDGVLRSMRDTSANHPSGSAGSGKDDVDSDDVSELRLGQ